MDDAGKRDDDEKGVDSGGDPALLGSALVRLKAGRVTSLLYRDASADGRDVSIEAVVSIVE